MAIILAAQNGNWSSSSTWTGGVVPGPEDIAVSNNRAITIDVDITCFELRNDTTGGATVGGSFTATLSGSTTRIINANITAGGNVQNSPMVFLTLNSSSNIVTINGNITGGWGNGASPGVSISGSAAGATVNVNGNIIGGINSPAITTSHTGGVLNINGNIGQDSLGAAGISMGASNGVLNVIGNVFGTGTAGGSSNGISVTAICTINITGNIGGANRGGHPISVAANATINITGNILGSLVSTHNSIYVNSLCTVNITGNVYGSNVVTANSIYNNQLGTVNIIGNCIGGDSAAAAFNNSTGTIRTKRATGNGFGTQSFGKTSQPGIVNNSNTGYVYVEQIEYGELGQSPTSGPIILTDVSTNVAIFAVRNSLPRTLVDSSNVVSLIPSANHVRSGVVYNQGNNTGTCNIPNFNSVVYGVAVDNTVGSGVLNPESVWNILCSNLNVSNSIGQRLKNCSTTAITGKQLEGAL
jgi:hypothetical protein